MYRALGSSLLFVWFAATVTVCGAATAEPAERFTGQRFTGPWTLTELKRVPRADWGEKSGLVQEVYYQGEPLQGRPTRVFAYYARPKSGDGPFPGMVLIHGGGGTAFAEWATLWAKRGYAALAMDLSGCGPNRKRLPNGMPAQDHAEMFRKFADEEEARLLWTYHAVAAAIRGHSLLAAREEVDAERTGVTGISWGGYLTCIVAGMDDRFKVAVPVYGCGFLHENSAWLGEFQRLGPEHAARWVDYYDPSKYLPGVRCPILFVNGTNDFAYPLDSYQKSYRAVPGRTDLCVTVRMPHGHQAGWAPVEIGLFVDSVLRDGVPLPQLSEMRVDGSAVSAAWGGRVRRSNHRRRSSMLIWQSAWIVSPPTRIHIASGLRREPHRRCSPRTRGSARA